MDDRDAVYFACFSVQQSVPETVFLSDIGPDGQLARKRKAHTKSRSGCAGCKARKVKCDDTQPCRNCVRRSQECVRSRIISSKSPLPKARLNKLARERIDNIIPSPNSELLPMNTQHLALLHHFEAFTSETFVMEPKAWKHAIMKLALQNEFLMHAVFLVAATHLKCLQPNEKKHQVIALHNLCQLLPAFRNAISTVSENKDFTGEEAEALIACSMLLLQYSWDIDSHVWSDGGSLALYRGLGSITLSCLHKVSGGTFSAMIIWNPKFCIENCMLNAGAQNTALDGVFAHILTCTKISDILSENSSDVSDILERMSMILWALEQGPVLSKEFDLELVAARYLFTLPSWFSDGFLILVKIPDVRAHVVLLYYLAAITKLKCDRFWWMTKRAIFMFKEMSRMIGDKCFECTGRAQEIFACNHSSI